VSLLVPESGLCEATVIRRTERHDVFDDVTRVLAHIRDADTGREYYIKPMATEAYTTLKAAERVPTGPHSIIHWARAQAIEANILPPSLASDYAQLDQNTLVAIEAVPFDGNNNDRLTDPTHVPDVLEGKPITTQEAQQILAEIATYNLRGVVHGDLVGNFDLRRENGQLRMRIIDPEPRFAAANPDRDQTSMCSFLRACQKAGTMEQGPFLPTAPPFVSREDSRRMSQVTGFVEMDR